MRRQLPESLPIQLVMSQGIIAGRATQLAAPGGRQT
ncbi:hypothetical protein BH09PSE5_BH09PSE5_14500 [soil metagenome]